MSKIRLRWIVFTFLTLLMPTLLMVAQGHGYFHLSRVSVEMSENAPISYGVYAEEARRDLNKLIGQDLWSLNLSDLESQFKSNTWVENVRISRHFPNELSVFVETKEPLALVLDKKGALRPLSVSASVLPPIRPDQAPSLPVIQDARIERDANLRVRVAKLLSELPTEGRLTNANIDQVSFTKSGQILIHHRGNGSTIHLGDDEISLRSARVARVLDYLDHNEVAWKEINADFQKKVVVKKSTAESPDLHIAQ